MKLLPARNKALVFLFLALMAGVSACSGEQRPEVKDTPATYLQQASAGIHTLQSWYVPSSGLYQTTGWWNSANAITMLVNYSRVSATDTYLPVLTNTFQQAQIKYSGFLNTYYDDEGWWALAWIDAYDLTKNPQYLAMAESIFADMAAGWDTTMCGGGIWWSKDRKNKNAIANELFLSVAGHLANRVHDPVRSGRYLSLAEKEWQWFRDSGMINSQFLVNDGLNAASPSGCVNDGKRTWSYNQGVILAGLVELNRAKPDPKLATMARAIAGAAILHLSDAAGILHDPCEPKCGADGIQFKGIFVRNLMALNDAFPDPQYVRFVDANADSIWANSRGADNQLGLVWSGPYDAEGAGSQSSALDALVAAAEMSKSRTSAH